MFYNVLTLETKPGKRLASFSYLREVAEWMFAAKQVPAMGVTNVGGPVYQLHMISFYESMAQYDRVNAELLEDEWFTNWFERAGEAVKWKTLQSHLVRVFRKTEMPTMDTQLMALFSMNLIPGVRFRGVDHLKKLSEHLEETYNLPSEVTSDEEGNQYRHHLSILFDNMDDYDQFLPTIMEDEWYGKWFKEAGEFMDIASMNVELARRV